MTVKGFFKSNVFKCLITLLCVLLVSGVFLTVMNGLLAVSDQERLDRAINKIYGKSVSYTEVAVADYNSNATIDAAYKIKDDGNYLIKSTGKGGFDNGTITCWVVVEISGSKISGIGKVVIDSNKGQTQMAELKDSFLNQFSQGYYDGIYYATSDGFLVSNSTKSSNAVCNAVNGALDFVNAQPGITGGTEDIYTEFDYIDNIETKQTTHTVDEENNTVTFTVVSKGYNNPSNFTCEITVNAQGVITALNIIVNGSTNDNYGNKVEQNAKTFIGLDLAGVKAILDVGASYPVYPGDNSNKFPVSGATESTYTVYTAALFATANYDKILTVGEPELPDGGETEEGGNENE